MAISSSGFNSDFVAVFLSELLGTALLVFLGCSSCLNWTGTADTLQIVLSFGFAVLICVQIFGAVSGAHINPSVTVAALVYKLIDFKTACAYVVAQCLGAFMGHGLLVTLTPKDILENTGASFCVTKPHSSVALPQAFAIEFLATAALIWFCCGVWDPRNAKSQDSVPLRFGLAVAGLASATCHFTGGSFNPARSLGPAIWNGDFDFHWLYWVAPLSGALVASVIYRYVFYRQVIEAESQDYSYRLDNLGEANDKV
ncbi:aquaporin AQPAn.G-like [Sitodiplosis mosellana]|uniref:aquaporin AQPAn.G-like n=1 Tax=Sitodiplosis mosellana TaxID=263140 RepID=UPI002443C8C7|nr:aquaporin AQPAn.G-like [Sitodiplosis mosellana]